MLCIPQEVGIVQMANEKNNMWTVYLAFGWHTIYNVSDDEFEHTKKFYKLFETEQNKFTNKRFDIFAWKTN